jgi:hypothetical protein
MSTSQFILEGYCQGAYPVEGLQEITSESWYNEILEAIRGNDLGEALKIAKEHFSAQYITESISRFEENGIRYIRTVETNLSLPFIENDENTDIPLFKWAGAHFLMEAPTEIVSEWIASDDDGKNTFCQERFDEWFGSDDCLQDGCGYHLGSCWYDLEGFGENGCSIVPSSVVAGLGTVLSILETKVTSAHQNANQKKWNELLNKLPSEYPLTGRDLEIIYKLLEEECPLATGGEESFNNIDKWARLAGYTKTSKFLEAIMALS